MTEIEIWVAGRDGTFIAPLPDAELEECSWVLNEVGSEATFSIDPLSEGAREIEGIVSEIQIWFDGWLGWVGVPWGLEGNSKRVTVTCEGLSSLFNKRFVDRTSLLYTSIDQFAIAWNLLLYAQSEAVEAYRDFNIDAAAFDPSGVIRSREYKREEHQNILDLVSEFNADVLTNGFDWEIAITPDGSSRLWTPHYPIKGQFRPDMAIEWDSDGSRNIEDFEWSEDFLPVCTLAYMTGGSVTAGETTIKKEGKYEDVDASSYWGQMQSVQSEGSQLDEDWLDDRAEQHVMSNRFPATSYDVTAAIGVDVAALGEVRVGDWIPVTIDHGRIQAAPGTMQRIHSITYQKNGTLKYGFGEKVA